MQMRSWRPATSGAVTAVDTIPASPTAGQAVLHTPTGVTLLWNGSAWTSMVPGVTIYPNPGGITTPKAVTLVGAALVVTNPATHDRSDGFLSAVIDDDLVAVTRDGEVPGFAGLTSTRPVYVAAGGGGGITHDPDDSLNVIPMGYAVTAARVIARMDTGTGYG